eukprot:Amastigsp_a6006_7.p2 type:complete len:130 gc:universal Amastigsp_a6006_7:445-834(+)
MAQPSMSPHCSCASAFSRAKSQHSAAPLPLLPSRSLLSSTTIARRRRGRESSLETSPPGWSAPRSRRESFTKSSAASLTTPNPSYTRTPQSCVASRTRCTSASRATRHSQTSRSHGRSACFSWPSGSQT